MQKLILRNQLSHTIIKIFHSQNGCLEKISPHTDHCMLVDFVVGLGSTMINLRFALSFNTCSGVGSTYEEPANTSARYTVAVINRRNNRYPTTE